MVHCVCLNPSIDRTFLLDRLSVDDVNRVSAVKIAAGGKAVNTALHLYSWGTEVMLHTLAGGPGGDIFIELLRKTGLPYSATQIQNETRSNYTISVKKPSETYKINEPGPSVTIGEWNSFCHSMRRELKQNDTVVLSGSLSGNMDPGKLAEFISGLKDLGLNLIMDMEAEIMEAFRHNNIRAFLVKPNKHEWNRLCDLRGTGYGIITPILDYADNAVISNGMYGATFVSRDECYRAEVPAVKKEQVVGAGDALTAAAVYCCLRKTGVAEMFRCACAAGSALAADLDIGSWNTVEKYALKIKIK